MKKTLFSAVALVAFSFAGMANEVKEKKGEVKPTETKKFKADDCRVMKLTAYSLARESGMSHEAASGYSYQIYFSCLNVNAGNGYF